MPTMPLVRGVAVAVCAGALLAGCGGGSTSPTATPTTTAGSPSSSSSASASGGANASLAVALSVGDLPSSLSGYTQTSDGLLGSTQNTDARVFASSDNTSRVEIDLAVDTSASAASSDYTAYSAAAQKQVVTATSTTSPSIGSKANEFVGTDSNNHSIVSLSFVQGSVIGVITMVSSSATVDASVVEAIANTNVEKITSAGL